MIELLGKDGSLDNFLFVNLFENLLQRESYEYHRDDLLECLKLLLLRMNEVSFSVGYSESGDTMSVLGKGYYKDMPVNKGRVFINLLKMIPYNAKIYCMDRCRLDRPNMTEDLTPLCVQTIRGSISRPITQEKVKSLGLPYCLQRKVTGERQAEEICKAIVQYHRR